MRIMKVIIIMNIVESGKFLSKNTSLEKEKSTFKKMKLLKYVILDNLTNLGTGIILIK